MTLKYFYGNINGFKKNDLNNIFYGFFKKWKIYIYKYN